MRDFGTTVREMIATSKSESLTSALQKEIDKSVFVAPEIKWQCWNQVGKILAEEFGLDIEMLDPWQKEIINILLDNR